MLLALVITAATQTPAAPAARDPFAFLQPTIQITADDRRKIDGDSPLVRILPPTGRELAVFGAIRVNADRDRVIAWVREIAAFKQSKYVLSIGRFSEPPRLEDLAGLSLDEKELDALRTCRPGHCKLKLAAAEMTALRRAADQAGDAWAPAVRSAFRQVVLDRVMAYRTRGLAGLPTYESEKTVSTAAISTQLVERSAFLTGRLPRFAAYLARYPEARGDSVETFAYWSKERQADKPVVSVTQVSIMCGDGDAQPEVIVAGQQLFATHYMNGSLGLTLLLRGTEGQHYLVYVNRTDIDVLDGPFAGLVRWIIRRRVKSEATGVLEELRRRLESGMPPVG